MTDALYSALAGVTDPASGKPLNDSGRINGLDLKDGVATLILKPGADGEDIAALRASIEAALTPLDGVERTRTIIETTLGRGAPKPETRQSAPLTAPARFVIAVASGKGGVGKSTVAANLAGACAKMGLKTGLMDADIYGPSAPRIFGLTDVPGLKKENGGSIRVFAP